MAEAGPGQASEAVPHDLLIAELEAAVHRATMENVVLRARIAARDRQAAAATAPAPGSEASS